MKRLVIITVLLFTFAALTACAESEYELVQYYTESEYELAPYYTESEYELAPYLKIYQLARDATYIVRVSTEDIDCTVTLVIRGVYKGGPHLRGIIELRASAEAEDIILAQLGRHFLFFLRSFEDGVVELLDDYHSVYRLVSPNMPYVFRNINRNIFRQDGFELEIRYHDLLEIWNAQMQLVFETYTPLEFNARIERGVRGRAGYPPVPPAVITSMDDLARHMDFYSGLTHTTAVLVDGILTPAYINDVLFGMYTEEFFEENFLVVLFLTESTTMTSHRVDAVLENGDIYLTRLVMPPGLGTNMAQGRSHIIIEINSRTIPEQFNLIINTRWNI